jgi:dTDP-4-dehydrorhamnose reductase
MENRRKMKTILVLGSNGMLGGMVTRILKKNPNFQVIPCSRSETNESGTSYTLDINTFVKCNNAPFLHYSYDYIANCSGAIKPRVKDNDPESIQDAILINSIFPHWLAQKFPKIPILQIATDCVFSGRMGNSDENTFHDALDVYGKTKSLGECKYPNVKNLRCSIIGPEFNGRQYSLVEWFKSMPDKANLTGYTTHLWNGITTFHFAKIIEGIIEKDIQLPNIQHIVPRDVVSKLTLLRYFAKHFNREDVNIEMAHPISVDRTLLTSNVKLNDEIWEAAGYVRIPTVEEMIIELTKEDIK